MRGGGDEPCVRGVRGLLQDIERSKEAVSGAGFHRKVLPIPPQPFSPSYLSRGGPQHLDGMLKAKLDGALGDMV